MADKRVFLDTNVIIECFRIGVWSNLSHAFQLETVEMVVTEAMTGNTTHAGHVSVNRPVLLAGLAMPPHKVTKTERNGLLGLYPSMVTLDDGEKHLFAHLNAHELPLAPYIVIGTADKGAIVAAHLPGWLDQLTSLEHLLNQCTSRAKVNLLQSQYTEAFLSDVRFKARMGIIP